MRELRSTEPFVRCAHFSGFDPSTDQIKQPRNRAVLFGGEGGIVHVNLCAENTRAAD
jgi:hypothetical protein